MEAKKNTGGVIIVVILSLIVWAIGGYLVYEYLLNVDNPPIQDNNNNNENQNQDNEYNLTPEIYGNYLWSEIIEFESYWTGGGEGLGEYVEAHSLELKIELSLNSDYTGALSMISGLHEYIQHRGTFRTEDNQIIYSITEWGFYNEFGVWNAAPIPTFEHITTMTFFINENNSLSISNDELLIAVQLLDINGTRGGFPIILNRT